MSELKNKILHDIVEPNKEKFKTSTFVGEVVKTYNCNRCKVDFIDKSGNTIKGKILPIRNYSDVSYLPSLNDKVIIKQEENNFEIIGIYNENYQKYKEATKLKADLYSNFITDTIPGYIY